MNTTIYYRILPFFCMTLLMASPSFAGTPGPKASFTYASLAGDFGAIKLDIYQDHSFSLNMIMYEFDNEQLTMTGSWQEIGGEYQLTITSHDPELKALFAESMILDAHTFSLDTSQSELWVWGMLCNKLPVMDYLSR